MIKGYGEKLEDLLYEKHNKLARLVMKKLGAISWRVEVMFQIPGHHGTSWCVKVKIDDATYMEYSESLRSAWDKVEAEIKNDLLVEQKDCSCEELEGL